MKKKLSCLWLLLIFNGSLWAVPTDYVVMRYSEQAGFEVDYHQVVDLPAGQYVSSSKPQGKAVSLVHQTGEQVWVDLTKFEHTRSETHGIEHIHGQYFENEALVFVVRVEQGWVDELQFSETNKATAEIYSWQELLNQAKIKGPQTINKSSGILDNRVNILFLGDGYTSSQQAAYDQDVDEVIAYMLTFEPYVNYADFHSFDRLFLVSNESGADKPDACYDNPVFVDTALDAKYCTNSIQRLLTVSFSKALAAAAASPNWDELVVIVNDDEYGGAGGGFSTISTNELAADVFIHEYGHTFTRLADEYESPYPGFPSCSDVSGPSCEANVTDVITRNTLKWNYFVAPSTPIPTPNSSQYDDLVGLFEGARYTSNDMYRPRRSCNMRSLGVGFCEVCTEAFIFRVYAVPYATDGQLNLIEPGSMMPAENSVNGFTGVAQTFIVDTLQPDHDLQISWWVDGVEQTRVGSSDATQSFQFTPTAAGNHIIKVQVEDVSPLVHASRQQELPVFEHQWDFSVQFLDDLIFADGFQ